LSVVAHDVSFVQEILLIAIHILAQGVTLSIGRRIR